MKPRGQVKWFPLEADWWGVPISIYIPWIEKEKGKRENSWGKFRGEESADLESNDLKVGREEAGK